MISCEICWLIEGEEMEEDMECEIDIPWPKRRK